MAVEQSGSLQGGEKGRQPDGRRTTWPDSDENKPTSATVTWRSPEEAVPPVALTFYSFRVMVGLGRFFPWSALGYLFFIFKNTLVQQRWLLRVRHHPLFLGYIASEAGWVVAEVGRQPWAIQGLLPVSVARSNLTSGHGVATFFMFLFLFTVLLVAEIRIMLKQISIGPEEN